MDCVWVLCLNDTFKQRLEYRGHPHTKGWHGKHNCVFRALICSKEVSIRSLWRSILHPNIFLNQHFNKANHFIQQLPLRSSSLSIPRFVSAEQSEGNLSAPLSRYSLMFLSPPRWMRPFRTGRKTVHLKHCKPPNTWEPWMETGDQSRCSHTFLNTQIKAAHTPAA